MNVIIKGKIVFIPIELKNREYKAKLLLANFFLQAGYSVCIGSLWHMDAFMSNAENSVYITKDFYKYRYPFLNSLHLNGNFVLGWDEEGLIYDTDDYYMVSALNKETLSSIDLVITWGERQKKTIERFLCQNTNKIIALGNPRLDLLISNVTKNIFQSEISYILQNFGSDYILVNSNFNVATREDYDNINMIISCNGKLENSVDLIEKYDSVIKALAPQFFVAVKHIAERFPEKKIIFRPHPAENIQTIQSIFKAYDNIYVIKQFAVNPWLFCASVIIHSGCTTGMEAAIMGKNVISYQPDISIPYLELIPDQLSKIVTTESDLLAAIEYGIDGKTFFMTEQQKLLLNHYVAFDKYESCSEKIVSAVKEKTKDGKFIFNTSIFGWYKSFKMHDFNIEFGVLKYLELKKDLLRIKKAMSFDYKQRIFVLTDNVFFITNKKSKIRFIFEFRKCMVFVKKIIKKLLVI